MPARERRPPQWLGEYVSRLYRIYRYITQKTEPVLEKCDVVNALLFHQLLVRKRDVEGKGLDITEKMGILAGRSFAGGL